MSNPLLDRVEFDEPRFGCLWLLLFFVLLCGVIFLLSSLEVQP